MNDALSDFLAHAVQLEADAVTGYRQLAANVAATGDDTVAAALAQLGSYSELHLAEMKASYRQHCGVDYVEDTERVFRWPDGDSPENPRNATMGDATSLRQAIELALRMERQACDYYSAIANQSADAAVQELAQRFAEEESEHVNHLLRWLARLDAPSVDAGSNGG